MLYDGETFYYENYFYDLQTHEKSISKIVFNSSSVTTGTNLYEMNDISFISRIDIFQCECISSFSVLSVSHPVTLSLTHRSEFLMMLSRLI